jgi:plastocyanin
MNPAVLLIRVCSGCLLLLTCGPACGNSFTIVPDTSSLNPANYKWSVSKDGGQAINNPALTVLTGQDYQFHVNTSVAHPFWIDLASGLGGANPFPQGAQLSGNGLTSNTTITLSLAADAPDTLYYACGFHSSMLGTINVVHDLILRDGFD